jgi:carboxypeptidase C (cathepsin A)
MTRILALSALLALAACGGGGGGDSAPPAPPPQQAGVTDANAYSNARSASLSTPNEISAVSRSSVTVGGRALAYTATAGHLTARNLVTDAPDASIFYVAYTLDGSTPATRPVTFFYNGGPGSASLWLHLGSFAPKRLAVNAPSTSVQLPFAFVDNAESLLDITDLVFVDAVGTGFSEAIAPKTNGAFWGVDPDGAVFRDFIRRYIAVNGRAASPRFILGESYGTTRSAVLAQLLESAGLRVAGVIFWSSILNYNSNCGVVVVGCAGYFPAYGEVGAYHQRTNPLQPPGTSDAYADLMRTLTTNTYAPAVATFLTTGAIPPPATLQLFTDATGAPVASWQSALNMDPSRYRTTLMPGSALGRYDARMVAAGAGAQVDISSNFITGSFVSTMQSYLANTLGYTANSAYATDSDAISNWDFSHDRQPLPDTIPDLMAAITINPRLKVLAVSGYHDLATPFFQTELDLRRTGPHPNITIRNYEGGHMTYLTDASRVRQKADLVLFYQQALQP